ncbi:MAG TPA: hypothetical protein GXZ87_06740 [Bacteroidales bacterium]|nr:hypothetical protein [Bacteroidales bacterium]
MKTKHYAKQILLLLSSFLLSASLMGQSTSFPSVDLLPQDTKYTVISATASASQPGEGIEFSYDDDTSTIYHSPWDGSGFPIILTYNFAPSDMDYIVYTSRLDGSPNGRFKEITVSVKTQGETAYRQIVATDLQGAQGRSKIEFPTLEENVVSVQIKVISGATNQNKMFASCAEMEFYKSNQDFEVFTDRTCSALRNGVSQADISAISNEYYRTLAQMLFDQSYSLEFRMDEFKAWPHPDAFSSANRVGKYSKCDNPTGIYMRKGEKIAVFAENIGEIPVTLCLKDYLPKDAEGNPTEANGYWQNTYYKLSNGLNLITAERDGLFYVEYFTPVHLTASKIKLHFAFSKVAGYFNNQIHTAADWTRLLAANEYEYMDVLGDYAHLSFPTANFRNKAATTGYELSKLYDEMVYMGREFMGYYKYPNRDPYNRLHFVVMYHSFMYATSYITGYNISTIDGLVDVEGLRKSPWGPAHEVGHVNQHSPLFKWLGTTEVTNNVQSLLIQTEWGNTSRLIAEDRYKEAYENLLVPKIPNAEADIWQKLVPLWQIQLFFSDVLGQEDFYAQIYEEARTRATGSNPGEHQINFVKILVDAAQVDITEFLEAWGFLTPVDMTIDDYGVGTMTITQAQVDELKAYIQSKNYPKPAYKVQYITDVNKHIYQEELALVEGNYSCYENTIKPSGWENVVAYEVYQGDELVYVARGDAGSFVIPEEYDASTCNIYAVQYDGTKVDLGEASPFTDFGTYGRSDNARKLNALEFSRDDVSIVNLAINQETVQNVSPVYFDKTKQIIEIKPGSKLTVNFDWTGKWMHNIIYVDWNADKIFATDGSVERIDYNGLNEGGEVAKPINYTIPVNQPEGDYTMRIMVDWLDANGQSSPNLPKASLNTNGGAVVDVILRVTNILTPDAPTTAFVHEKALVVRGAEITIVAPEEEKTIVYTTDGTKPNVSPTSISGVSPLNITLTEDTELRAVWLKEGKTSFELVQNYTIIDAVIPQVSSLEKPVYYYIMSAVDTNSKTAGTNPSVIDAYGKLLYIDAVGSASKYDYFSNIPAEKKENALWAIVNVDGVIKLKNKGTGAYMNESDNSSANGTQTFVYNIFEGTKQFRINNSGYSHLLAWTNNTTNKWRDNIGVNSLIAWYFVSPAINTSGNWSDASKWTPNAVPTDGVGVIVNADVALDMNVTAGLSINEGKTLSVNSGKNLTLNDIATNNGTIKLLSDATNGTATLLGNVTGKATVEQAAENHRTYYIGSPVSGEIITEGIGQSITFDEATNNWSTPVAFSDINPIAGKGYGIQVGIGSSGATIISVSGTLNNNTQTIAMTMDKRKFNFVGNPYPSFLNAQKVIAGNAGNVEGSLWFYLKDNGYKFITYNVASGFTIPEIEGIDGYIPPMQGFWVKAAVATDFIFTDEMRLHKPEASKAIFRAPQAAERKELRLQITNGTETDETLLLFCEDATEDWNSSKAMNPGLNIYTLKDGKELALNSRTAIEYGTETPVGIKGASGECTFSTIKYVNFGTDKAFLIDKLTGVFTDLSSSDYTVNFAEAYSGTDRFALVFASVSNTPIFSGAGNWSDPLNWEGNAIPEGAASNVTITGAATLDQNVTVNNLTIKSGATFILAPDKQLTVNGTAIVEQEVQKPQTYYIGSPISNMTNSANIGNAITFTESSNTWSTATAFANPTPGKGYGVQVGAGEESGTATLSFTGTLNGNVNIDITSTTGKRRFNFLGNPYPSYLDGADLVAGDNLEKTIWLFFKEGTTYQFKYRNVGVPGGEGSLDDAYIAPMQGFWVRLKSAAAQGNHTFAFTNAMRKHKGTSNTVFHAPQASEKQVLRLAISNGTITDEATILFSENANSDWNSSKLMNSGLNIYTVKAAESLALNSRTAIEYDVETAVGVKAESGVYTFSASKFENFGTEKVFLLDKVAGVSTELSTGDYTVTFAEAYEGTDRFALIFPRSGVISGLEDAESAGFFAFAKDNCIIVSSDAQGDMIYVFNGVGQQVTAQAVSGKLTTLSTAFPVGVYVVKVNNHTTKVVVR